MSITTFLTKYQEKMKYERLRIYKVTLTVISRIVVQGAGYAALIQVRDQVLRGALVHAAASR